MDIDIVSDVVCPWCYIGKRQIEAAIAAWTAQHPDRDAPRVHWKPFELNPQLPPEGMSRQDYVLRKFGAARSSDVYARVAGVGAQHGIAFDFDRIARQPNTLAAHSLIALAAGEDDRIDGLQSRVKEAFLRAFFLDGVDLTDPERLLAIGTGAGLDRDAAARTLEDAAARAAVARDEERMRAMGVQGVPFFIFGNRLAVSGAQGTDALLEAMRRTESIAA